MTETTYVDPQVLTTKHRGLEILSQLQDENERIRSDAATVVYALDRALQLIDALINFLPEGLPLDPRLGLAKEAFDEAYAQVRNPPPPPNVAMLIDQRNRLTAALETGLKVVDAALNECARLPNLPISLVVARNQWHDAMEKLLK